MIQDIAPRHLYNEYIVDYKVQPEDVVFMFEGNNVYVQTKNGLPVFPKVKNFSKTTFTYLFKIDDMAFVLANEKEDLEGYEMKSFYQLRDEKQLDECMTYALHTAKHLSDWYRDTKFCGRCGKPMHHSLKERAMVCECGYTSYPRIMPAVIVGVIHDGQILITKYATGFAHNALIAGFVEIGETIEETVKREVYEEAGLRVKNIRYYKSQPWGMANDILLGYYCEVDGDPTIHFDHQELKIATWTKPKDIVLQPDNLSLTNEMMRMFKEGKIS